MKDTGRCGCEESQALRVILGLLDPTPNQDLTTADWQRTVSDVLYPYQSAAEKAKNLQAQLDAATRLLAEQAVAIGHMTNPANLSAWKQMEYELAAAKDELANTKTLLASARGSIRTPAQAELERADLAANREVVQRLTEKVAALQEALKKTMSENAKLSDVLVDIRNMVRS